jgi:Flp pilus assembly protein TadG
MKRIFLRGLGGNDGSVSVVFALVLPVMLLAMAILVDLSLLYVAKQRSQIVADVANLAAVSTTTAIVSNAASAAAVATAANVAEINGFGSATVTTTAVASPLSTGDYVLKTAITKSNSLFFGSLTGTVKSPVSAASWAGSTVSGECLKALLADIAILTSTTVTGDTCTARAKTDLYVCWDSTFRVSSIGVGITKSLEAGFLCSNSTISPAGSKFTYSDTITNTYASDSRISAIKTKLLAMASGWSYGVVPPVNVTPVLSLTSKTYSSATATLATGNYANFTATSSSVTFSGSGAADASCTSPTTFYGTFKLTGTNTLTFKSGCYVFGGTMTIAAGAVANFKVASGASVVFMFKNGITTGSAATVTFDDATYYFNYSTLINGTGSTMQFGDGTFYLWSGSFTNSSSTSTMTFGDGPVFAYLQSSTNNGTLTFGNGTKNFNAVTLSLNSGSTTTFGTGNIFYYGGGITASGDALSFGASGSTTSGSGTVYMISATLTVGKTTWTGTGMTFAFYLTSIVLQNPTLNLIAPMGTSPSAGYRDILFVNLSAGISLYQYKSQQNSMSGIWYSPIGFMSITGNSTTKYPTGGCFHVVGGTIGFNSAATVELAPCRGFSTTTESAGTLIQ